MRSTIHLTLRQHRLGFSLVIAGCVILLLVGLVGSALMELAGQAVCRDPMIGQQIETWTPAQVAELQARCEFSWAVMQVMTGIISMGGNILPLGAAVFLAAPLVAQEVETTTATLSWTLARSRNAWYLPRMALVMLACVGTALVLGLLVDWAVGYVVQPFSPFETLTQVYQRGMIIPSRVAVTAASCLLAGALVGRQVPALVVGIALAALVGMGLYQLDDSINRSNARRFDGPGIQFWWIVLDRRDGRVVPDDEAYGSDIYPGDLAWEAKYESVAIGIPDSDAPLVISRNVAFHGAATVVLLGASTIVVGRRRPY